MKALIARALIWLARLVAGPLAAREAGRLEAIAASARDSLTQSQEVLNEQARIAARPAAGRDELLRRMRDGTL